MAADPLQKLQALRDCYLIHSATAQEKYSEIDQEIPTSEVYPKGKPNRQQDTISVLKGFLRQYRELSTDNRLRRALVAAGVVNLSQQLCGM